MSQKVGRETLYDEVWADPVTEVAKRYGLSDAVEHAAKLKGELTDELVDWISWARAKADWLDPMIRVSDLILDAPEPEKPAFWW